MLPSQAGDKNAKEVLQCTREIQRLAQKAGSEGWDQGLAVEMGGRD